MSRFLQLTDSERLNMLAHILTESLWRLKNQSLNKSKNNFKNRAFPLDLPLSKSVTVSHVNRGENQ